MSSIKKWMTFFLEAGIPDVTAATYATNFANNRIEMTMLMDLNKDYLKEMDINLLGDIILILKHAKKVAEKNQSDLVLGDKEKHSGRVVSASLKPFDPTERRAQDPRRETEGRVQEPKREAKPARKVTKHTYEDYEEPPPKKSAVSKPEPAEREIKKEPLNRRLGPKVEAEAVGSESKNSVFSRLGDQEAGARVEVKPGARVEVKPGPRVEVKVEETEKSSVFNRLKPANKEIKREPVKIEAPTEQNPSRSRTVVSTAPRKPVETSDSGARKPESGARVMVSLKSEKTSAFDRLDKPDSTQVCRVSSTNDAPEPNPSRGILKQRGVIKGGLTKSKSTSSIISLKQPQEAAKKKVRVSFGENDVRCMSPKAGIKARLGLHYQQQEEEEEEMERDGSSDELETITMTSAVDLRQNLVRSLVRSGRATEDGGPMRTKGNLVLAGTQQRTGPVKPTEPQVPTVSLRAKKKFYIVQTLSDGTKSRVEVPPDHPLIRKTRLSSPESAERSTKVRRNSPAPEPSRSNPTHARLTGITRRVGQDDRPGSEDEDEEWSSRQMVKPIRQEVRLTKQEVRPIKQEVRPIKQEVRPIKQEVRPVFKRELEREPRPGAKLRMEKGISISRRIGSNREEMTELTQFQTLAARAAIASKSQMRSDLEAGDVSPVPEPRLGLGRMEPRKRRSEDSYTRLEDAYGHVEDDYTAAAGVNYRRRADDSPPRIRSRLMENTRVYDDDYEVEQLIARKEQRVQQLQQATELLHLRSEGRSYEGRSYEGRSFEGRSFEGRSYEGRSFEGRSNQRGTMRADELVAPAAQRLDRSRSPPPPRPREDRSRSLEPGIYSRLGPRPSGLI